MGPWGRGSSPSAGMSPRALGASAGGGPRPAWLGQGEGGGEGRQGSGSCVVSSARSRPWLALREGVSHPSVTVLGPNPLHPFHASHVRHPLSVRPAVPSSGCCQMDHGAAAQQGPDPRLLSPPHRHTESTSFFLKHRSPRVSHGSGTGAPSPCVCSTARPVPAQPTCCPGPPSF